MIFLIIVAVVMVIVLTISIVMYFLQYRILFHPEKLSKDYKFSFANDFEEINLKTDDGNILNGLLLKSDNSKGLVVFYHNRSGNINHWSASALYLNNLGHDVLMMDYRGFGKSTGKFNEQDFLKDSELWYNYALENYDESIIAVCGKGIGATFATYVASLNNPKLIWLESPMYNSNYTAKYHYPYLPYWFILKYKLNTNQYIVKVKCKIYIFHGKRNKLVTYMNSLKLYELSKENIELYLLPESDHYNLVENSTYYNKIREVLRY